MKIFPYFYGQPVPTFTNSKGEVITNEARTSVGVIGYGTPFVDAKVFLYLNKQGQHILEIMLYLPGVGASRLVSLPNPETNENEIHLSEVPNSIYVTESHDVISFLNQYLPSGSKKTPKPHRWVIDQWVSKPDIQVSETGDPIYDKDGEHILAVETKEEKE